MSSQLPPSGDLLKQSTDALSTFVRWIAELIVTKNWFTLLILVAIANLFLFKPTGGIALAGVQAILGITSLPTWYGTLFWAVEAGLLVGALAIAICTLPRVQNAPIKIPDYKAIKGLRPFTQEDAEVFAQLQRQGCLRECLDSVTSPGFRFGILHGVSGCGKTSFLQAGVLPRLSTPAATHRAIYVRLGGQDPVRAIASALSITLEIPTEWLLTTPDAAGFRKLLDTGLKAAEKPLILFLDQFEQFFVYYPREEQRQPFVQALTAWYTDPQPPPVSIVVSVRSDLLYQLDELHKALRYALGPQEVFRLEKFTPTETVNVLKAIAQLENLNFEARFITELAEAELTDRDDGRISPVDVQILAWMIEQQPQGELRAFDRNAFQKFGGVEGLLQRFLERTLDARMLPNQRQSALKVLLALTDLDRQVRAGVLTIPDLTTKLKDTLSPDEVAEAVQWLARGDVRLVTPQEREGVIGYELAHERLIPALLRQTQKELTDVERARQLLDRRVNEWLGNQRDKRYAFNFKELWLIRKQRPYLDWGAKREQKEKLIRLSQWRVYGTLAALLLLFFMVTGAVGWLRFTPSGQLQGMYWQLNSQLANASADQVAEAAVAFAKNNQWSKAFEITHTHLQPQEPSVSQDAVMSRFFGEASNGLSKSALPQDVQLKWLRQLAEHAQAIQDDASKSYALSAIAAAYTKLQDPNRAKALLQQALSSAQAIQDDESKFYALSAIAAAAAKLQDPTQAKALLQQALSSAQAIQDDRSKSYALSAIAAAYAELQDPNRAEALLQQALSSAQAIQDDGSKSWSKSYALSAIAAAAAELQDPTQAKALLQQALSSAQAIQNDESKSSALRDIAAAAAKLQDPTQAKALLQQALSNTQALQNDEFKSYALSAIAAAYAELQDPTQAKALLQQALNSAQAIQDDGSKSSALSAIAATAAELQDPNQAKALLQQALSSAQALQNDGSKSDALSAIAAAAAKLQDPTQAKALLQQALSNTQALQSDYSKSYALRDIAAAYAELQDPTQAKALLQQALSSAQAIQDDGSKSDALRDIAAAAAKLQDPTQAKALLQQALSSTQAIQNDEFKSNALSVIAAASWAFREDQSSLEAVLEVARQGKHGDVIRQVVFLYAKQGQWNRALSLLRGYGNVTTFSQLLTIQAENRNPKLIDGAVVLEVAATGNSGNYTLEAILQSPDESCEQHASWWEMITPDGTLVARQVLNTVHREEQPFTNLLASVNIAPDQEILIRAYFQGSYGYDSDSGRLRSGYTDQALRGSIAKGFKSVRISPDFAGWLENDDPQPGRCVE